MIGAVDEVADPVGPADHVQGHIPVDPSGHPVAQILEWKNVWELIRQYVEHDYPTFFISSFVRLFVCLFVFSYLIS